nr:MAG TPA: hypothetical protein [Caudoviricetes sp.]
MSPRIISLSRLVCIGYELPHSHLLHNNITTHI